MHRIQRLSYLKILLVTLIPNVLIMDLVTTTSVFSPKLLPWNMTKTCFCSFAFSPFYVHEMYYIISCLNLIIIIKQMSTHKSYKKTGNTLHF